VLDAWAVLALVRDEPAAERVEDLIDSGATAISSVNLGEVLYTLTRSHGLDRATSIANGVRQTVETVHPDWPLIEAAALVKSRGGLSYADAFCVATALRHDAPLATGDPEILALDEPVELIDLREAS